MKTATALIVMAVGARRNVPPYVMINPVGAPGAAFDTAVMPAEAEVTQVIPGEEIAGEFFPEYQRRALTRHAPGV